MLGQCYNPAFPLVLSTRTSSWGLWRGWAACQRWAIFDINNSYSLESTLYLCRKDESVLGKYIAKPCNIGHPTSADQGSFCYQSFWKELVRASSALFTHVFWAPLEYSGLSDFSAVMCSVLFFPLTVWLPTLATVCMLQTGSWDLWHVDCSLTLRLSP